MSILTGTLAMARGQAVARFTETLTAFYKTQILDPETGLYGDTEVVLYTGVPGRVKFPSLTVFTPEVGAQVPAIQDVHIHVAVGACPDVVVGHLWRVTASTADSSLVGREFRTKGLPQAGQVSASRFPVEGVA